MIKNSSNEVNFYFTGFLLRCFMTFDKSFNEVCI